MRFAARVSFVRDVQARNASSVFRRQHTGGAAAATDSGTAARERVIKGNEELEFELKDRHVHASRNSEASQASSRHNGNLFTTKSWADLKKGSISANAAHLISTGRVWRSTQHMPHTPPQEKFIIMSFNILASTHAHSHRSLYPSVPDCLIDWGARRLKIIQGLDFCSPDIICLQEVDKFADLEEDLASRGYIGLYKGRTGEMPDGCAIFWRKKRFQLLQEQSFEFSMLGMKNNVAQLCVLQSIVPEGPSGSVISRTNNQIQSHCLVVGNIHVLFNPKRGDIKLGQCRAFLEQVHNMSSIWFGAPVVIGGDFNSTPSSAVYKYLATSELELANLDRSLISGVLEKECNINDKKLGEVPSAHGKTSARNASVEGILQEREMLDRPDASIQQMVLSLDETCINGSTAALTSNMELTETVFDRCFPSDSTNTKFVLDKHGWNLEKLRIATGKDDCTLVQHDLNLHSAYSDIQGLSNTRDAIGEPLLTSCHNKFIGTVDYIWRNEGLRTMRVLDTPPITALRKNKGLPIKVWGSDHLPLVCELAFTRKTADN